MRYNLSEIVDLIKDRRTIYPRFFSERKVHKEQIELLLNAAIWAPTHKHTQPWRYKVFMEESRIKLAEFLQQLYLAQIPVEKQNEEKYQRILMRSQKSSAIIAICLERDKEERLPIEEEIMAVAASVQNMLLVSAAYGLGAFWSTPKMISTPEMKEFLKIGEKDKCLGLLYIGYPGEEWPRSRRKPIEYVTEWIEN